MSAWMSGIGLGLQAAQMEQSRNQQAQELAFRQQQAGINNAQEDRRFEAAQTADIRDFDAMQQWRAFQRQQQERQYQDQAAALERDLAGQRASAMVYKAVGAPMQMAPMPGMAMGEGQANYSAPPQTHPLDMLDDQTLMAARPDALRAYVGAQQDRSAMTQRRQMAAAKVQQARAAGVLKYVSPEQADEFANLGFYSDGTILPDEMPIPLQKQREQQHEALARLLATSPDAEGNTVTDPAMFEHYRAIPMEMAEVAFRQKRAAEAAMQLEQLKGQMAAQAKGAAGLPQANKTALGAMYGKMAKELDKKPEQTYSRQKYVEAQSAAIMGNILPDGSVVLNAGNLNPQGFIDVVHPDGYTEAIAPEEFQRRYGGQESAGISQRGILDGPNGSDPLPDEQQTIDALSAQGLSVDEIEAKMREMGYQ